MAENEKRPQDENNANEKSTKLEDNNFQGDNSLDNSGSTRNLANKLGDSKNECADIEKKNEEEKVVFIISRHKKLFEMLKSPRQALRATLMMAFLLMVLFVGLTMLTLILKKNYPYNLIKSNEYGAFLMQSEDSEMYHFMYNTAEIFANSGVEVKKGEEIRIKASGRFQTAIQHLADNNVNANWLDANGKKPTDERDIWLFDNKMFISPETTPEKLLCFVVGPNEEKLINEYLDCQKLYLEEYKHLKKLIDKQIEEKKLKEQDQQDIYDHIKDDDTTNIEASAEIKNNLVAAFDQIAKRNKKLKDIDGLLIQPGKNIFEIGKANTIRPGIDGKLFFIVNDIIFSKENINKIDSLLDKENNKDIWPDFNDNKLRFRNCPEAWYLDNVGSLLITIDKRNDVKRGKE